MSITRSDLPHVAALPPEKQREAVDAMWRAYAVAEKVDAKPGACPVAWVATMTELLEAALRTLDPPSMTVSRGHRESPTFALADGEPWRMVLDTRIPPGVALVGDSEAIDRMLADWTRNAWPEQPVRVAEGEVVFLKVERPRE